MTGTLSRVSKKRINFQAPKLLMERICLDFDTTFRYRGKVSFLELISFDGEILFCFREAVSQTLIQMRFRNGPTPSIFHVESSYTCRIHSHGGECEHCWLMRHFIFHLTKDVHKRLCPSIECRSRAEFFFADD